MVKKLIKFLSFSVVLCILFTSMVGCSRKTNDVKETASADPEKVNPIVQKIEANNAVQTYINNLALYNDLIEIEPGNIDWYIGLADTYALLGKKSKYKSTCKTIVAKFPDDKTGYLKLIKFYSDKGRDKYVISTYNSAPDNVKKDKEFLSVYKKSEWSYRFIGMRYETISNYSGTGYVYSYRGKYGFRNKNIYTGISAKYTNARPFIENMAAVQLNGEWYFIDTAGYRVLATNKYKIEDLYSLSENYAVAKVNGKYGYIDATFKQHAFNYDDATSFFNGVAAVKKDGKWALINKQFKLITDFVFDDVIRDDANVCSRNGVVFLRSNGSYKLYNSNGKQVSFTLFNNARPFYTEYAAVQQGEKWGFIDKSGKVVIDYIYDDASSYASELAAVKKGDKWGLITVAGKIVIPFEYGYASITSDNGVAMLQIKDKYKFLKFRKFS